MTAQSIINQFSIDEEIEGWVAGDDSVEISGYVDAIDGLKQVSTKHNPHTPLYKIVINNGSKTRVRVLFWAEFAKKYSHLIDHRSLITLKGAKTKLNTYVNPADIVSRLELIITKSTDVIISAQKFESDYKDGEVPLVAMADLENVNAVVDVTGFLKQEFRQASTPTGSYASGVLVDKNIRLPLRVIGFKPSDFEKFKKGAFLKIRGRAITPTDGPTQLRVDSFGDIFHDENVVPLSPDQLRLYGIQSPKRKFADV